MTETQSETGAGALRPLHGVRVTDLTAMASGPYCTLMLALLGAEVIRVETRTRPDIGRRPHPVYGRFDVPNFDHLAGHKKSITLNLKTPDGLAIAHELIGISHVLVENYRPGVMERLGLGWTVLHERYPSLIMISISANGQYGPQSRRPGYAPIFAAEGGLSHGIGYPDGAPAEVRNQMDHMVGLTAAVICLGLLEERDRIRIGARAVVSAREVATMLVGETVIAAIADGRSGRRGHAHEQWCPHNLYRAAGVDRWLAIVVRSDAEWATLVDLIGSDVLATPKLTELAIRLQHRELIDAEISTWAGRHDAGELAAMLQAAGISAELSMAAPDVLADAHLRETGALVQLHHPEFGSRTTIGAPWTFHARSITYDTWSPELGEHNEEIICGLLGHATDELERWVDQRVVY